MLETSIKTDKLVEELNNRGYICIDKEQITSNEDLIMLILLHFKGKLSVLNNYNYTSNEIVSTEVEISKGDELSKEFKLKSINPLIELASKYEHMKIQSQDIFNTSLSDILKEDRIVITFY
ncbi:MAG: hypothetical protein ACRDBY_05080 [Cetobacterium sp.]